MPGRGLAAAAAAVSCFAIGAGAASAHKAGGTLRVYQRDNRPSASILEEATSSVTIPYISVCNNLIMYDNASKHESAETTVGALAESWSRDNSKTTSGWTNRWAGARRLGIVQ